MKNKKVLKRITTALLVLALMTSTAFAGTATQDDLMPEATETANMLISGQVVDVEKGEEYNTIEISRDNMGMIFHVNKNVFVVDQKSNKVLSLDKIEKNMEITVVLDKMSPTTMSIPPQTNGAIGIVIRSEFGSIDLSIFDGNLINLNNTLALNIPSSTQIIHENGSKKLFSSEDIKGKECLVLYSIATLSIPAQTAPELVVILNTANLDIDGSNDVEVDEAAVYVPLRTLAEEKGYKVKWQSHDLPILLTKNDMKIELFLDQETFNFTHKTKDIKPLDRMKKLDLAVLLLNSGITMVPDTFIDAL